MVKKTKTPPKRGLASLRGDRGDPPDADGPDEFSRFSLGKRTKPPRPPERPIIPGRHAGGRPLIDPDDLRSERYGMRMHPDLRAEVERLARLDGLKMAGWIERAMIDMVNKACGSEILDKIGRYKANVSGIRR
jgi:hypothetical protein